MLVRAICNTDESGVSWSEFWAATCKGWNELSDNLCSDIVFRTMLLYFKQIGVEQPIVLIAVDDVIKCGVAEALEILSICKVWLCEHADKFRLLATALDDYLLVDRINPNQLLPGGNRKSFYGPSRPVHWLPLSPLSLENPRKQLVALNALSEQEIDFLMALSGGHPQSLALLKTHLMHKGDKSFLSLRKDWEEACSQFAPRVSDDIMKDMLARAILRKVMGMYEVVCGTTVQSMVQDSVLVNALDPCRGFVPQLSLLRLHQWCQTGTEPVHVRLRRLLELRQDREFYLAFEELRLWAHHHLGLEAETTLWPWFSEAVFTNTADMHVKFPVESAVRFLQLGKLTVREVWSKVVQEAESEHIPIVLVSHREAPGPLDYFVQKCRKEPKKPSLAVYEVQAHGEPSTVDAKAVRRYKAAQTRLANYKSDVELWTKFRENRAPVILFDQAALLKHYGPTFEALGRFFMSCKQRQ